ncbi:MAG: hypothetical protein ABF483_09715 [Liquorilactobacillus nagelii]|uniref:Uncharacterized protein n=1 Tax=Liquorilactobacillus nagelii TaxID=82688 RepID=A0A3S6QWJ4_9LACO|nr:hypothetical protein [Liquorilactobacillus nagelii]AUJ32551.1 hypothetical protein BSQ50_08385 [Liquorilactobacillus nagelii]MCC7616695.1 hypothetical protein [Liquorilactobacillus nagelii]MCP9316191.1 hypothetical protein [Liquorilactobacillus nagelii]QYH53336.1 hypothetical protein G6O73_00745 [Liquorilactobacillus nagelii DSM 13675]ULQ49342.1 hypothetical protein J6864_10365 [Liquorilactobacillus nagelii]
MSSRSTKSGFIMAEAIIGTSLFCVGLTFFLEQNCFLKSKIEQTNLAVTQSEKDVNLSFQLLNKHSAKITAAGQELLKQVEK